MNAGPEAAGQRRADASLPPDVARLVHSDDHGGLARPLLPTIPVFAPCADNIQQSGRRSDAHSNNGDLKIVLAHYHMRTVVTESALWHCSRYGKFILGGAHPSGGVDLSRPQVSGL